MRRTILLLIALGLGATALLHRGIPRPHTSVPAVRRHGYLINQKAIRRAKGFTVLISAEGFAGIERGTGVIIDSTHILTCAHVAVHSNDETFVYIYPGYLTVRARPVYVDVAKDLAVMEIDIPLEGGTTPVFQEKHFDGEPITIIGNTLGSMKWFVAYGIISGENSRDLYTDGLVKGGDSGGPWINDNGEIVALSDWGLESSSGKDLGISGGISAKTINTFLKSWKDPSGLDQLIQMLHGRAPVGRK